MGDRPSHNGRAGLEVYQSFANVSPPSDATPRAGAIGCLEAKPSCPLCRATVVPSQLRLGIVAPAPAAALLAAEEEAVAAEGMDEARGGGGCWCRTATT